MHTTIFLRFLILNLIFVLIAGTLNAIPPAYKLETTGGVYDFVVENDTLYAATNNGTIEIFIISQKKKIEQIDLPKIKDFAGDMIAPKLFSVDKLERNDNLLIVAQGEGGFTDIYLIDKKRNFKKIKSAQTHKLIAKRAVFEDRQTILIGLMSNELILCNISSEKPIYKIQLGTSVFSDFTIDKTRAIVTTCEESGKLRFINIRTGKTIKVFSGENKDNVYKVAYANLTFVTAGQDRKVAVYKFSGESYAIEADFLIYSVGISQDGQFAAYPFNEKNHIQVFNTKTKQKIAVLEGQKSTLTKIYFLNNNTLITASEDNNILVWEI